MTRIQKSLIGVGVMIAAGVGYWLISPLFIERRVQETLEEIPMPSVPEAVSPGASSPTSVEAVPEQPEQAQTLPQSQRLIIASGTFIGLAGHSGQGTAQVIKVGDKYYLRFEEDFQVTNGPDLFVHFGRNGEYDAEARVARLKGNAGSQNYEIPSGIDPTKFNEIWIWCRAFSVPFAKAVLTS